MCSTFKSQSVCWRPSCVKYWSTAAMTNAILYDRAMGNCNTVISRPLVYSTANSRSNYRAPRRPPLRIVRGAVVELCLVPRREKRPPHSFREPAYRYSFPISLIPVQPATSVYEQTRPVTGCWLVFCPDASTLPVKYILVVIYATSLLLQRIQSVVAETASTYTKLFSSASSL